MNSKRSAIWKRMFLLVTIVVVVTAGCAAPAPEIVEKEVVVEKKVIETVIVEKEVVVEKPVVETVVVEKVVTVEVVVTATPESADGEVGGVRRWQGRDLLPETGCDVPRRLRLQRWGCEVVGRRDDQGRGVLRVHV